MLNKLIVLYSEFVQLLNLGVIVFILVIYRVLQISNLRYESHVILFLGIELALQRVQLQSKRLNILNVLALE